MINFGICENEMVWVEEIKGCLNNYALNSNRDIKINVFMSAEEFMKSGEKIDILLLDIEMPGMSGIELKELLNRKAKEVPIIFISSHTDFIADAFGRNVYGFIHKPVDSRKLAEKIDKIVADKENIVSIPVDENKMVISSEIIYIRASDKYVDIITTGGARVGYLSLKECEEKLPAAFYRITKSYLINFEHVLRIKEKIEMTNGDTIKLPRGRTTDVKNRYRDYLRFKIRML